MMLNSPLKFTAGVVGKVITIAAVCCWIEVTTPPLYGLQESPRLGKLSFPASAPDSALREFELGVLWLHSFEYSRAAAAFQRAERLHPDFVMAVWGEAMTYTHPIWNQQDVEAGRASLRKLGDTKEERLSAVSTPRERRYLEAVEVLYGEGPKPYRDTAYAKVMERLVAENPTDMEAKAFYSLALLGLNQGIRDTATYRRAAAWADTVFANNPDHPGAAHYLIHAWDDPYRAANGLEAAKRYIDIAPDAAHAQHMTTHIFLALGMWDLVVSQNTVAMNLQTRLPGHYSSWLHYGLLQQGRFEEAGALLGELRENMYVQRALRGGDLAFMRAAHILHTREWFDGAANWLIEGVAPSAMVPELYYQGAAAFQHSDTAGITRVIDQLRTLTEPVRAASALGDSDPVLGAIEVTILQLRAYHSLLSSDPATAVRLVRQAAAVEDRLPLEFGPPGIVHPSYELLGELLVVENPAAAVKAYQRALELAPGRSRALLGLVQAAGEAGDLAVARKALEQLAENYAEADPAVRLLIADLRSGLGG